MKKKILAALALSVFGASAIVYAAADNGDGIVGSPHDLATTYSESQGRICAFCHTPHHAATTGNDYLPLWSRDADVTPFNTAYNSATINAIELSDTVTDKAIGPTRLCMSCHDGSIAPDQHYGGSDGAQKLQSDVFGDGAGVGAGNGLTNDHPVGFSYVAVAAGPATGSTTQTDVSNATSAQDAFIRSPEAQYIGNTLGIKIQDRLYAGSIMTCATCHDVHNKKNAYVKDASETINYLTLAKQGGSSLCLSCHIK